MHKISSRSKWILIWNRRQFTEKQKLKEDWYTTSFWHDWQPLVTACSRENELNVSYFHGWILGVDWWVPQGDVKCHHHVPCSSLLVKESWTTSQSESTEEHSLKEWNLSKHAKLSLRWRVRECFPQQYPQFRNRLKDVIKNVLGWFHWL